MRPKDTGVSPEWLRRNYLIYGALIAIGVVMVQPFLTSPSLDRPRRSASSPSRWPSRSLPPSYRSIGREAFRRRMTGSVFVSVAQVVAQTTAIEGVVAGSGTSNGSRGVGMLVSGIVGVAVHSAGSMRLEGDQEPPPQEGEEPDAS
jgi:hypothetical protein